MSPKSKKRGVIIMNNQKLRDLTRNNKSAVANIQDLPQQRNGAFGRSDDKGRTSILFGKSGYPRVDARD